MRVVITGVSSRIGRLLAARLIADPEIDTVTGLDSAKCVPPIAGLRFVRAPLGGSAWRPVLDDADALIVLPGVAWPQPWRKRNTEAWIVAASKHMIEAAAAARVNTLIVANSAALYGAQPAGSPTNESASVHGHRASVYAQTRAQIADYLTLWAATYPGTLTQLRVAWLCGPRHVALLRQFSGAPVRACGTDARALSLVHEADFVAAVRFALHHNLPGVYNVAAADALSFNDIAALTSKQPNCVPLSWLVVRAYVRWRWLRWRTPPLWVRSLYQGAPLDTSKLTAAGWHASHTARAAFVEALDVLRE